ncbi:MAG: sigma-70 family RNA polymerase sigma factor [Clostridia bacterium]|nr:sigma-70 family RNA polymerase sigma factor [Clostridia bacterium]
MEKILKAIEETLLGNKESYSLIVSFYMQRLYSKAIYMLKDEESAKDIVQEVFIEAYIKLSSLREKEKIEAWFMQILRNKAINYIKRSRVIYSELEDVIIRDDFSPEALYIADEEMEKLKKEIASLSPVLRETAMLYFIDDMSMDMIAKRLGIPLGTVKRRIYDARQRLKKEKNMEKDSKLSDSFVKEIAEKIEKLENYYDIHGSRIGFDDAYSGVKDLIYGLSSDEDVKEYSVKGIEIALGYNRSKYADDALGIYMKYNEVQKAACLLLNLCWELNRSEEMIKYTLERVLPTLEKYPDGAEKDAAIAGHYFWMARYWHGLRNFEKSDEYVDLSIERFKRSGKIDSYYANVISCKKANQAVRNGIENYGIIVTAEQWGIRDNNLYFCAEPGFSYETCSIREYDNYVFLNAGWTGDRYFFPKTLPLEAGREEIMKDEKGNNVGIRKVVSVTETVESPAGIFNDCVRIERIDENGDRVDIWYKEGVGLVRLIESTKPHNEKLLSKYDIKGGGGLLPLEVGNRWCYSTPGINEEILEINEYVIEQRGVHERYGDSVTVSAFSYFGYRKPLEDMPKDGLLGLAYVSELCGLDEYEKAKERLQYIIEQSDDKELRNSAKAMLPVLEEKLPLDKLNWRFLPSSTNISEIQFRGNGIKYYEGMHSCNVLGHFGTRHEENRIFGAKPFRYLCTLCGTLWDDKWVTGYKDVINNVRFDQGRCLKITVLDGGKLKTPAGVFENTLRLILDCEPYDDPGKCQTFFYDAIGCGVKEYWYAKNVGIVRFKCTWDKHLTSDLYLTEYNIAESHGEMLPIYVGNSWRYEEKYLTEENYIARRDYNIISGNNGRYRLADSQFFTWRGSVEEYEEWKKNGCKKII